MSLCLLALLVLYCIKFYPPAYSTLHDCNRWWWPFLLSISLTISTMLSYSLTHLRQWLSFWSVKSPNGLDWLYHEMVSVCSASVKIAVDSLSFSSSSESSVLGCFHPLHPGHVPRVHGLPALGTAEHPVQLLIEKGSSGLGVVVLCLAVQILQEF